MSAENTTTTCHLAAQRIVPECCGQSPCVHAMPRETVHIGRAIERLRAAWLRVIQAENSCAATGQPCREAKRCGCAAEQAVLIGDHDNAVDRASPITP